MKFVIQRVRSASVTVEGRIAGSIQKGLLVLIGVGRKTQRRPRTNILRNFWGCGSLRMKTERPTFPWRMWGENFCWSPVYPLRQLPQGQPSQLYRSRKPRIGGTAL